MTKIAEALSIMKTKGWMSGPEAKQQREWSGVCMHLALCDAYPDHTLDESIGDFVKDIEALSAVCVEQYPELADPDLDPARSIWAVNDAPGRTVDEVERIMEKAYIKRCSEL